MSESQSGAGRREVAYRLFASEFDDSDFSYSESDEERAPNYVVTPTGARVNRLFVVGVLTEIETVSEDYLRARVVDPTGPFVVYAGQYQPDALAFLERADPPAFVAVTGKARTYQPDDSDRVFTSVRPERISEVDAATRDRWVVQTAEQTVDRVARTAEAKSSGLAGDDLRRALAAHGVDDGLAAGVPVALEHYGTTGDYLDATRDLAIDAARVVADEIDEVEARTVAPDAGGDDAVASLVERPIDADAVESEATDEAAAADEASAESDAVAAEPGAGNGSAIGTAASGETVADEATETTDDVTADEATAVDAGVSDGEAAGEPAASEAAETGEADAEQSTSQATTTPEESGDQASATEVSEASTEASEASTTTDESTGDGDDLDDFEPEFDLDDDEREELEEEFGTEFQSGTEVDEPGSADIETPEPESEEGPGESTDEATADETASDEVATEEAATDEAAADADAAATEAGETVETEPVETDASENEDGDEDADLADVDLEDAVMEAMQELDEGDGADRDAVLAAVVDRAGADPGDVEDAVQDALMGGRCYEPDDETLKPI